MARVAQKWTRGVFALAFSLVSIETAAQTIALTPSTAALLGSAPGAVASADFNHDGRLDFATVDPNASTVSVFLATAGGAFAAPSGYGVGAGAVALQGVDINHDHATDLVSANVGSSSVSILINSGSGTFAPPVEVPVGAGPTSLAVADFNRDGQVDLVTTNSLANTISIRLGTGAGTFGAVRTYPTGPRPQSVVAVDLNRDSKIDLAVASGASSTVSVRLGSGDGLFSGAANFAIAGPGSDLATGDFNRDGRADLIAATSGPALTVLLGNGSGGFAARTDLPTSGVNYRVLTADFNGDARLDIAAITDQSAITLFKGHIDGTFRDRFEIAVGSNMSGRDARAFTTGDFDRDGKLDLLIGAGADAASGRALMFRNATPFRSSGTTYRISGIGSAEATFSLTTGDFNRDARLDLATARFSPLDASVFTVSSYGTVNARTGVPIGLGFTGLVTGDFNRDGRLDLAGFSLTTPSTVSVVFGNGNGSFGTTRNVAIEPADLIVAADFNNDDALDLVTAGGPMLSFLPGVGNGTFGPLVAVEGAGSSDALSIVAEDVDADGNLDLAFATRGSNLLVRLGNGDGTFAPDIRLGLVADDARSLAAGDFNGDGKLDFATADLGIPALFVMLGHGDGSFDVREQILSEVPAGTLARPEVRTADFNRDGKLDLAMALAVNAGFPQRGPIEILNGQGDGTFTSTTRFAVPTNPTGLAIGDFNRDGKLDLAAAGPETNAAVVVLLNTPSVAVTSPNTLVNWGVGSVQPISWTHTLGAGAPFRIDISRDGGLSYLTIAGAVTSSGATSSTFNWTVTGPTTNAARIRVVSIRDGGDADSSNLNFAIGDPFVRLTSPSTHVTWTIGSTHTFQWSHNIGIDGFVRIDVSRDGGASWTLVAASVRNTGTTSSQFRWTVDGPPTTSALVRVSWMAHPEVSTVSKSAFTIASASP